jgi:hypothetical protein
VLLAFISRWSGSYFDGPNDRRLVVNTTAFPPCTATNKRFIHFDRVLISDSVALWSH